MGYFGSPIRTIDRYISNHSNGLGVNPRSKSFTDLQAALDSVTIQAQNVDVRPFIAQGDTVAEDLVARIEARDPNAVNGSKEKILDTVEPVARQYAQSQVYGFNVASKSLHQLSEILNKTPDTHPSGLTHRISHAQELVNNAATNVSVQVQSVVERKAMEAAEQRGIDQVREDPVKLRKAVALYREEQPIDAPGRKNFFEWVAYKNAKKNTPW